MNDGKLFGCRLNEKRKKLDDNNNQDYMYIDMLGISFLLPDAIKIKA